MPDESVLIDGHGPVPVVSPSTVDELGEVVRRCAAEGRAVYPLGGRTMLGLGMPPARAGLGVDVRNLTAVIDYPARDMTVTVQAGITLARLQEILAPENQRLPIDVPRAGEATLGGILAVNASGPRRHGYGTLRDYVLGLSAVNDEGREVKSGGRVVKNVAGYDLCKLFIGSLGTLGVITQVTLKLRPRAEEHALITLACSPDGLEALLDRLHGSRTRPVCLELLNAPAARWVQDQSRVVLPEAPWVAVVGYEGNAEAVKWQVQQLVKELRTDYSLEARIGLTAEPLWNALGELPAWPGGRLTFKANLLPAAVGEWCRRADGLPERPLIQAHAGNGIVTGHFGPGLTKESGTAMLKTLRDQAAAGQGCVILPQCPADWKNDLSVWGPPRGDFGLMRAVKDRLDPRGMFNPGRFVDGI